MLLVSFIWLYVRTSSHISVEKETLTLAAKQTGREKYKKEQFYMEILSL